MSATKLMAQTDVVDKTQCARTLQGHSYASVHQDFLEIPTLNVLTSTNAQNQTRADWEQFVRIYQDPTLANAQKEQCLIQIQRRNAMKLLHVMQILIAQEMQFVITKRDVFVPNQTLETIADVSH